MRIISAALICVAAAARFASAEPIKIGIVHNSGQTPFYLALDKGYFAAEGLEATLVPFDAAQPVAVAVVSGDIDFGAVAATGGFYSLAGQGALKIIAGETHEVPGFQLFGFVVSNGAYAAGLKSVKDLPGHSVAVTQVGSGYHYALALLAEKYAVDLKSIRLLPLQSIPNIASALTGGQADSAMLNATASAPLLERGAAKLVAWSGDETPYQATVLFTSTKIADDKHDMIERFFTAYRKGAHAYHDAFTGKGEIRADGPTAAEVADIIAKHTGLPPDRVKLGIGYDDPDGRLDVKDILHQVEWFRSQGLVKGEFDPRSVIDKRYAVPLPEPRS